VNPLLGLSRTLWPAHLKPLEDELLSSWLVRLSMAHGTKLHTFCSVVWPGKQIWNRDIDKSADASIVQTLSDKTAVSRTAVADTTLAAYEGILYEYHNSYGNTLWIMPLGIYHRTHTQFGLQFCPRCLAEDETAYYRRHWRLAFITCCTTHSVVLFDRCQKCRAPVNFHRDEMGTRSKYTSSSIVRCYACKADLREDIPKSSLSPSDPNVQAFQIALAGTMAQGGIEIPGYGPLYSHLYFAVVHQLMRVLAMGNRSRTLREAVNDSFNLNYDPMQSIKRVRYIEHLTVNSRAMLINMARCLLEEWPQRFIRICTETKTWSSSLLKDCESAPFWFWSVIHDYLSRTSYSPSDQEILSAVAYLQKLGKPLSKKAISKCLGVNDAFRKRKTKVRFDF